MPSRDVRPPRDPTWHVEGPSERLHICPVDQYDLPLGALVPVWWPWWVDEHQELVAITDRGDIVGIASYARDGPDTAEIQVYVADDWQRRGIATKLVDLLQIPAAANGIHRFNFWSSPDNTPVNKMLARHDRETSCVS